MIRIVLAFALAATMVLCASGQTFSQPVRDVENEARNAVEAACSLQWTSAAGMGSCDLMTVPAGKRLAVRHVAVHCFVGPNNRVTSAFLSANLGAGSFPRPLPLSLFSAPNTRYQEASLSVFYHADPGKQVQFTAYQTGPDSTPGNCQVSLGGFLVNTN
jgi:hypothetical protein